MTDFMGFALFFTGLVIVGISLHKSRHSNSCWNSDVVRRDFSDQQIDKVLNNRPKRADTQILDCTLGFSSLLLASLELSLCRGPCRFFLNEHLVRWTEVN